MFSVVALIITGTVVLRFFSQIYKKTSFCVVILFTVLSVRSSCSLPRDESVALAKIYVHVISYMSYI